MWRNEWLKQFPQITFLSGAYIFRTDEAANYNYYLISGICAQIYPTIHGESCILNYYQTGKMLGINLHRFGNASPLEFVAKTNCLCYKIPWETVDAYVKNDNHLCYSLLQETLDEYEHLSNFHIARALGGGISMLCMTLKQFAVLQPDHTWRLDPIFTNIELSNYCGIHAVSVSRLLSKLTRENILARTSEGIVIYNMDQLSHYIEIGE